MKKSGFTKKTLLILFALKVIAGIAVGLVNHFVWQNSTDYDHFNNLGIEEYELLRTEPAHFFSSIFKSNYSEYGELFGSKNSYWNDLRENLLIKILAVLNIFSRGNYYINSLFLNCFCFFGHVALYRIFIHVFPGKKLLMITGTFLLPSLLYFSSGIHKDLFVFTFLCFFCYAMYFSLLNGLSAKKIILISVSFLSICFFRNFIIPFLLPCGVAWFVCKKGHFRPAYVFGILSGLMITATAALHFLLPKYDPLAIVASRQQAFLALRKGSLQYNADTLQATFVDFARATPPALRHVFFSPYPGEFDNFAVNLFSIEMLGYVALIILAVLRFRRKNLPADVSFLWFALFFSLIAFLFNGYITPNAGALIRYRSIYLPFFITPLLGFVDKPKFSQNIFK